MKQTIVINGIEYEAIDRSLLFCDITCGGCDIYQAKIPQSMMQFPLCCEEEYIKVNESCREQFAKGIKRIWKKV